LDRLSKLGYEQSRKGTDFCRAATITLEFGLQPLRVALECHENRHKHSAGTNTFKLKASSYFMRLFIALDIDDAIRERISCFANGVNGFAPDARWAKSESLHITLKFIGEQPEAAVEKIKKALSTVAGSIFEIHFRGYGFFPTPKSARVFWIGMEAGPQLPVLAAAIDDKLASLGLPKEDRAFTPHLTLARGAGRSASPRRSKTDAPNLAFERLQAKLADLTAPEFGTMTARAFFLYQSHLSPKGSTYTKLAAFDLE
jgi:2'-5' RNA ligase